MARAMAPQAWAGFRRTLIGPDPAPAWRKRSVADRRAAYLALGMITIVLAFVNAATVHGVAGPHGQLPARAQHIALDLLPPSVAQRMLAVAVVAPLLLAVWSPMVAWRIGWIALLLGPVAPAAWWGGWPWGVPQMLALLGGFCVAGISQYRAALWWMWIVTLVPWWLWLGSQVRDLGGPISATLVFTAVVIAIDSVSSQQRTQRALNVQTKETHTERAQRATLEERARIARELHDVVAHHMSLVAVRAETAPYRLTDLPAPVRAEFAALSDIAREALGDMRRLLGVFRDDQSAALAPQPQITDLPTLVASARQAGVSVNLSIPESLAMVPPGVGLCTYRIVQESLSNAGQHAPGAAIAVSVDLESTKVVLRVANGPADPANATSASHASGAPDAADAKRANEPGDDEPGGNGHRPGHGLAGMRERVALLGGSLAAGPTPDGGFVVSALLPLSETA
jgi:signal transduction histidine kinase